MGRARIGDAPGWITRHVLAVFVGLTAVLVLYVGAVLAGNVAAGWWPDGPPVSPRVVVTTVVVAALLNMARTARAAGPLHPQDRTYYRWATWFIGLYGLMGAWFLGPAVAAVLLVHSWTVDRAAGSTRSGR